MECYRLPDNADDMIPADIRQQFQRDANGRVLFFTAPPLNSPAEKPAERFGHSAKYLAWRVKRDDEMATLRRKRESESGSAESEEARKRLKQEQEEAARKENDVRTHDIAAALHSFEISLADVLIEDHKREFGPQWKEKLQDMLETLAEQQQDAAKDTEEFARRREDEMDAERSAVSAVTSHRVMGDLVP